MTDLPAPLLSAYLTSADSLQRCPPDDEPEVAFVGRSNAGKSSTLNRLTGNKHLARVSKTPGRTQLLNFFAVQTGGRLVDLPGYGYARAPQHRRAAWASSVDHYLNDRLNLVLLVHVMDARRPLERFDRAMLRWCRERERPFLALLNKADKLNRSRAADALRSVQRELPAGASAILFSAQTGLGAGEALQVLRSALAARGRADTVQSLDAPTRKSSR